MNLATIKAGLTRAAMVAKKYSPEILTGVSILTGVGATVFGIISSTKVKEVHADIKENLDDVRSYRQTIKERIETEGETEELKEEKKENSKELMKVYGNAALEYTKLYWPTVALTAASITSVLVSHGILKKRNAALVAAYAALNTDFKAYRERVKAEYGEEAERKIFEGANTTENVVMDKDGNVLEVKKTLNSDSPYYKIFDECNENYSTFMDDNFVFIKCAERQANDLLHQRSLDGGIGWVLLNEVYDMLGFRATQAGALVGWTTDGTGDGYIDFGLFNREDSSVKAFVNNDDKSVILDFNVDGVIYDKLGNLHH